ncbi:unnamed protein product, partial [Vitis vinifera]
MEDGADLGLSELGSIERCRGVGFRAFNVKRASPICTSSSCLYNTGISVCSPTLWDSQSRLPVCTNCDNLAFMHQCNWSVHHFPLESLCLSSSLPIQHVEIFEEDPKGRLDVIGWNSLLHNRVAWDSNSWPFLAFFS